MKKGQICEGVIEMVEFPNKSVIPFIETQADGEERKIKVSAKGGIPGQRVSFSIKKARKENCKGRILEVIEKSPLETEEPVCPKFGLCGGCNYQTLPYEKQLELKKNQVAKLIEESCHDFFGKKYIYDGILGSPDILEYRNKMEFSFGDAFKDGPLTLGLHKKGSFHDILDADCCQIVHEDFRKILVCVRDFCAEKQIPFYNKNSHEGILRHLLVRRSSATGEMLAGLVISSQRMTDWAEKSDREIWEELTGRMKELFDDGQDGMEYEDLLPHALLGDEAGGGVSGKLAGFLLIINDSLGDVVQSDRMELLYGKDFITEKILGLQFRISPFSFFQTNSKGAEVLYRRARDYILGNFDAFADTGYFMDSVGSRDILSGENDFESSGKNQKSASGEYTAGKIEGLRDKVVFDLYSGTGTIAQMIAPIAKKVIGVEIVEEAVEAARENAALNGLTNCEFIAGDVLKVLDEIEEKPDVIILDPPRDGIHPKALPKIIAYGVEQIVYISCKPTSLARDLVVFLENGYEMTRMSNVDMFPETVHVETVVQLVNIGVKPDYTVRLEVDVDEFYKTVGEEKRHFVKPD